MLTVPWRQASTAWGWLSDLDRGENNSHHQSRADAVLYGFCIDPCPCSKRIQSRTISSPSFSNVHNSFRYGQPRCVAGFGKDDAGWVKVLDVAPQIWQH
jgi:hypothetical protein